MRRGSEGFSVYQSCNGPGFQTLMVHRIFVLFHRIKFLCSIKVFSLFILGTNCSALAWKEKEIH
jgi:hypothetical protein